MSSLTRVSSHPSVSRLVLAMALLVIAPHTTYAAPSDDFVTTWDLTISGSSTLSIPFYGTADIDWNNDGLFDDIGASNSTSHNYGAPGVYTVRVSNSLVGFTTTNAAFATDLVDVNQWGTANWSVLQSAFYDATNMTMSATDAPNLSGVTDLTYLFKGASAFNTDINHWDVSTVTGMFGMFFGASSFNQPLDTWNTSNVTDMGEMFRHATAFNQPISSWDTASVTSMANMFSNASTFNQPIDAWNTANVTTMNGLFHSATAFNQPIGSWNTANVTDMASMFQAASSFNQPIGLWNTSNVIDFDSTFYIATSFDQPIDTWNTSSAVQMNGMFGEASAFNQPLNLWNVSAVGNMTGMFNNASSFNQPLDQWTIGNVTQMSGGFGFFGMFDGTSLSSANYDTTLIGWAGQTVQPAVTLHVGSVGYCAAAAHDVLTNAPNNWIITDGGPGLCDSTPPLVISASVLGRTLTLQLDEPMDNSLPASSSFTVVVNEQVYHVTLVQVEGSQVRLTLNQPVGAGSTAKISYTAPGVLPCLTDLAGHPLASFTNVSVSVPGVSGGTGQGLWEDEEPDTPESPESPPQSEPEDSSIHNAASEKVSEWPILTKPRTVQPLGCHVVEPSGFWYDVAKTGLQSLGLTLPDRPLGGTISVHEAVELLSTISTRASDTASALGLRPNRRLRRADAVQLLVELNQTDDRLTQREAVALARNQCILRGYPDGSLQLEQPINWAEFLTLLYRTVGGGR
jgi:uncharacterized repeat protein (TIGR02059 family)